MKSQTLDIPADPIDYPCSDGKPMADSTLQFLWIDTIKGGIDFLFRNDPNVFVAGDLLWYPVEGSTSISAAPDVMVVFDRPKGHRDSYVQSREGGIAPQVVFEVLSKSNAVDDMMEKLEFYDLYAVEEYYLYDPRKVKLFGWLRQDESLQIIKNVGKGWISPRLNVRFDVASELILTGPDGRRLIDYLALAEQRELEKQRADDLEERLRKAQEKLLSLGVDPKTLD